MSSTLLKSQGICGWCGKEEAPSTCPCKQVCFCNTTCQKNLWSEHRMICTSQNAKDGLAVGDIVKIHGLKSEAGQRLNGYLAEIISYKKENNRYQVIFTAEECMVKTASVKNENLELHLSLLQGAKGLVPYNNRTYAEVERSVNDFMNQCKIVAKRFSKTETGVAIVERLKNGDREFLQALTMKDGIKLTPKQSEGILQHGFIDMVFKQFDYPSVIDDKDLPFYNPAQMITLLSNLLFRYKLGTFKEKRLNQFRVEACKKMGPFIMAASTKKRRLFRRTEHWVGAQVGFASLVQNCLLADKEASTVFLNQLDPVVRNAFLNHVVYLFSSEPKLNLKKRSGVVDFQSIEVLDHNMKKIIMPSLVELMDVNNVGEAWTTFIGKIRIPPGVPHMANKPLAEVIFQLFALAAVEEIDTVHERRGGQPLLEEVRYIYKCMYDCSELREIMGPFNHEFANLVRTPTQLLQWAKKTLACSC